MISREQIEAKLQAIAQEHAQWTNVAGQAQAALANARDNVMRTEGAANGLRSLLADIEAAEKKAADEASEAAKEAAKAEANRAPPPPRTNPDEPLPSPGYSNGDPIHVTSGALTPRPHDPGSTAAFPGGRKRAQS